MKEAMSYVVTQGAENHEDTFNMGYIAQFQPEPTDNICKKQQKNHD